MFTIKENKILELGNRSFYSQSLFPELTLTYFFMALCFYRPYLLSFFVTLFSPNFTCVSHACFLSYRLLSSSSPLSVLSYSASFPPLSIYLPKLTLSYPFQAQSLFFMFYKPSLSSSSSHTSPNSSLSKFS